MRGASIERLAKIISDTNDDGSGKKFRKPLLEIHIGLAEGWFSLVLLAIVSYSTIWCVQAVGWVDHLGVLSLMTALGLLAGVLAAKQQRFSRWLLHISAFVLSLLLAFWQTVDSFYEGSVVDFVNGIQHWLSSVSIGGTGDVDAIFFFFIVALSFILAYTSAWLVYRTRAPWLMIVANAVVLLINLSNVSDGYIIFLIIFLIASLLLLLRFNLYESMRRWKRQGLRYAEDLGWDVMQAGALISIGILIFSWILPGSYVNSTLSQVWNLSSNPWTQIQNTWNRVISVSGGVNPANRGNFRDSLSLGGNPNLTTQIVFNVQFANSQDNDQYITSLSYDTYNGAAWTVGPVDTGALKANEIFSSGSDMTHSVLQKISVVNPPGEQSPYLLGASEIVSVNLPSKVQTNQASSKIDWQGQNGYLVAGQSYTVTSSVSSADEQTLRTVPMPSDAPQFPTGYEGSSVPVTYFYPAVVDTYTQLPKLDPRIAALAKSITRSKTTMYVKVVALESYLRSNYSYNVNIHRPSDEEGVAWFLFDNPDRDGFCNYFSSAMTVMARSLGIPARVAVGYTHGTYDAKHKENVIRGTDAHSWTQVYFAGYGWINFEPSASFAPFARPLPSEFPSVNANGSSGANGGITPPVNPSHRLTRGDSSDNSSTDTGTGMATRPSLGTALGGFILLILFALLLFSLWWRRLFRNYGLPAQLYGRVCTLAEWAGIKLQPAQTPYEYMQEVALLAPKESETLERLGDIYVRDRWADPASKEHPRRNGEIAELPGLWKQLQPPLFLYVLRHPHFLRRFPAAIATALSAFRRRRRAKRVLDIEDF
jgi:transglutaminase-like putative cysteine protease